MRKIASGITAAIVALLLAGCSWTGTGVVSSKYYKEAHTYPVLVGKVIVQQTSPECYGLNIAPDDEPEKRKSVCINKDAWDMIEPGQPINVGSK